MRALLELEPRRQVEYEQDYNHNVRGYIYQFLEDEFPDVHSDNKDIPFTFSNFFPPRQVLSDKTNLIIASQNREYFDHIVSGVSKCKTINIGEMPFKLKDIDIFNINIKQTGELRSEHGIYCTVDSNRENPTYWKKSHGVNVFMDRIEDSLDWKIDQLTPFSSQKRNFNIFDGFELQDTFARPVTVEEDGNRITMILSNWKFEYTIRNGLHEEYIRMALNTGVGWKNTLGFGFVNQVDQN